VTSPIPPLRWVGGKRRQASQLRQILSCAERDPQSRYIEPFLGGGSVYFAWQPERAVLSDANPHLISFFQSMARHPLRVLEEAEKLVGLVGKQDYLDLRDEFNTLAACPRRSAIFLYLNMTGFNGIWRVNREGRYNVPYGDRSFRLPSLDAWRAVSVSVRRASLRCEDWRRSLNRATVHDVIFVDPPYLRSDAKESFVRYTKGAFSTQEHMDLAARLIELDALGCQIVVTIGDDPTIRELYAGFKRTPLNGSFTVRPRGPRESSGELLFRNFG
jgi:DNA adenine methylase